ncbi:MAG: hypothetical protein ABIJ39_09375 [Chloroflexota bacterium]
MNRSPKQFLYWTPRILAVVFILFVSMFAMDVFAEGYGIWEAAVALFMHLLPSIGMVIALVLGWKWEWLGSVGFGLAGVWFLVITWGHWGVVLMFAGVPLLIAGLFLVGWLKRKQIRAN